MLAKQSDMLVGTRKRLSRSRYDSKIQIGGVDIKQVLTTKSLGILVDKNLNWYQQVDSISKKVSKGIGMLRRVKQYVSQHLFSGGFRVLKNKQDACTGVNLRRCWPLRT